jgi:hypothetical protein
MKLRRAVLIVAGAAVIAAGAAVLFYSNASTQDYRACVALMWDRKHPAQLRQRYTEQAARKCEKDRLSGANPHCDPNWIINECEKLTAANHRFEWKDCIDDGANVFESPDPDGPVPTNPCEHLSLEELRRADADASRDKR